MYPNQVTTGTEWSREGTLTKETDGVVTEVIPTRTTYRVLATDATAPWSGITGCVLLRTIEREGEVEETEWDYYKPGIGLVESTDTDPELDQSAASGSYLVPNVG